MLGVLPCHDLLTSLFYPSFLSLLFFSFYILLKLIEYCFLYCHDFLRIFTPFLFFFFFFFFSLFLSFILFPNSLFGQTSKRFGD